MSAFILAAVVAIADPVPSASPSPVAEIGRVQAADRRDERLSEAIRTTNLITRAEIDRRGDRTVGDALARVPGFTVIRSGPLGALNDVVAGGYTTKAVLILLDGRPLGGQQTGLADLGAIPTTGIERIEVVQGGGATLYGTGAEAGVINIVTTPGPRGAAPRLALTAGSFGERALTLDTATFAFERRIARNDYAYPALGASPAGSEINADLSTTSGRLRTAGKLGALRIDAQAGARTQTIGVPGDTEFPPLSTTARERSNALDARVALAADRPNGTTALELSATRSRLLYTFAPDDPAVVAGNLPAAPSYTTEGRVQASLRSVIASGSSTVVAGIDLAHGAGRVDSGSAFVTHAIAQTAAYAQDTVTLGRVRAYGGLRAERDGDAGGAIAPSGGVAIPLGDAFRVRANVAGGFRVPDFVDRYFPGYASPNLQPERSTTADVDLDLLRALGGVSLRWFTQNGTNIAYPNPAFFDPKAPAGTPAQLNAARYAIDGFVLDARTRPFAGIVATLGVTDVYRALDLTANAVRLPRRPVVSSSLALEHLGAHTGWFGGAGALVEAVGPHTDAFSASPARLTEYTRVDAYVRARIAPGALVTLRGRNLGNERFADVAGFPQPGRSFEFELSNR